MALGKSLLGLLNHKVKQFCCPFYPPCLKKKMSGYNLLELAYSDFVIEIISRPKQAHIMNRCTSLKAFFWKRKGT